MEIEIAGHSGCNIEITNENGSLFIVKSTNKPAYVNRLRKQALKQRSFQRQRKRNIKAPRIFDIYSNDTCCKIRMEYVYSLNSITFIENAGLEQIDNFLESMNDFVTWEISLSEVKKIDNRVFIDKYNDVKDKILANKKLYEDSIIRSWFPLLDRIFNSNLSLKIPVGVCHGDLTFSNILFCRNSYYLIDFLDSFVETPLMDIVKLRQDTAFNWSGLMYSRKYDQVRHEIVLNFMDRKIVETFSGYDWYRGAYGTLQILNFLRVLQYAHESKVVDFLKIAVAQLLEQYEQ